MAKKNETQFVCSECGFDTPRWEGQCPSCKEWNTLREFKAKSGKLKAKHTQQRGFASTEPVTLAQVQVGESARMSSGMGEVDRCLGGGFVPDEVVLVAGEPGIGKSTLLLQIASSLEEGNPKFKISKNKQDPNDKGQRGADSPTPSSQPLNPIRVLYVAGEESPSQIKLRAERLGIDADSIAILPETDIDTVAEVISRTQPAMVILDSIQTMQSASVEAAAGSPLQIRTCTQVLFQQAKHEKFILVVVGHITKEGNIAGPKLLEHMVDAVLYLEGDAVHAYRLLRVYKNRFGATDEVGVFSMTATGLTPVDNPSAVFLEGRPAAQAGSVVVPVVKGNRCFLVEIQALVSPTSFSLPRRTVSGIDFNRAALIIAVLQKKGRY